MHYVSNYKSPIGNVILVADEIGLTGLWLEGKSILLYIWTKPCRSGSADIYSGIDLKELNNNE